MQFKVATDVFSGPMDLLLYLVKREEVDITAVPIARIATEFIAALEVLEALAIDQVGEFVELASILLEIKARALVPRPEETEEAVEPVREDLVRRLLEYKQYRDAAVLLEDRARQWELRFARTAPESAPARGGAPEVTIGDVHVWDLVGAMARVLRKREKRRPREIVHDETPIETHIARIEGMLAERGRVAFSELFDDASSRSRLVGMFLAVLELVRRGRLGARQDRLFEEIWLEPPPAGGARGRRRVGAGRPLPIRLSHPSVPPRMSMIDNAPVRTLVHKGLTIEGWSRAAVQSYWRIPELKVGFDLGAQPWSFMGTGTWFLSHTHLDHVAALPVYVARRRMMKMEPPVIYVPETSVEPIERLLRAVARLDRGRLPCTLLPARPGDEIELSREHVVTVSSTTHTLPSIGFVVWERRRKLKQEYHGLPGDRIRDLRLSGVDVTHEVRTPLVAYLGDSSPEGLDRCPAMFEATVLITEMTFVAHAHRKEKIHKFGHMHLDDLLARRDRFRNEVVIASHFSTRYTDDRIRRILAKRIPDMLDGRLQVWL